MTGSGKQGGGFCLTVTFSLPLPSTKIFSHRRNTTQTLAPRALSCPADRSSASPSPGPSSETPRSSSWTRPRLPWTRRARRWASLIEEKKKQSALAESAHFIRRLLQILPGERSGCSIIITLNVIIIHHLYYYRRRWRLTVQSAARCFEMSVACAPHPHQHLDDSDQAARAKLRSFTGGGGAPSHGCRRRVRDTSCASMAVFPP